MKVEGSRLGLSFIVFMADMRRVIRSDWEELITTELSTVTVRAVTTFIVLLRLGVTPSVPVQWAEVTSY